MADGDSAEAEGMRAEDAEVVIHTDGSCRPNPGAGGWAAVLRCGERRREISGAEAQTTNNRMELQAIIESLKALKRPSRVAVHTDSEYVRNAFVSKWLAGWKRGGWMTRGRTPVKNRDLWQQLDALVSSHKVRWIWVKGHSGDAENERCDVLAAEARRAFEGRPGGGGAVAVKRPRRRTRATR